jgi:chromosome segregation ATPase
VSESKKQLKERIDHLKVQLERATRYSHQRATELNDERVERQAQENKVGELEDELSNYRAKEEGPKPNWDALREGI